MILHGVFALLGFNWIVFWGMAALISMALFVKFMDFEPMWALFAWFLFSFIFNILLASFLWLVETNDYQAGKAYFPDAKKEAHFNEYLQENNVDPNDSEAVLEHVKNMPKFQR